MDSQVLCRINPMCKRLQAGILCPHIQAISTSQIHIQKLPQLARKHTPYPLQPTISPILLPVTPTPTLLQPHPIRATPLPPSPQPPYHPSQSTLSSTTTSPFRPIILRQRVSY